MLENFRPGPARRMGTGLRGDARAQPRRSIMVHVSGFGQTGPRAAEAGFGSIGEAVGGIRFTTGNPDLPPTRAGISLGDSFAALFAVIGTMAALNERHLSGRGQEVDVAIYEAVAALMESSMVDFEVGGVLRHAHRQRAAGRRPVERVPDVRRIERDPRRQRRRRVPPPVHGDGSTRAGDRRAFRNPRCSRREHGRARRADRSVDVDRSPPRSCSTILAEAGVPAGRIFTAETCCRRALRRPRHGAAAPEPGRRRACR